ncbi:hypothetical protein GCM10009689_02920 [Brevibacterium antiquum]
MSSHRLLRLRNRRIQALIAGIALAILVLGLSGVRSTMAAWTDTEQSAGSFRAATVPAPTLTANCKYVPVLLSGRVEIYWHLPTGYQLTDVDIEASTSGLGSVLAPLTGYNLSLNTTSTGGGNYTTKVPAGVLTGLLGSLGELQVSLFVKHTSGWRSGPASIASDAGLLFGGKCRNLT